MIIFVSHAARFETLKLGWRARTYAKSFSTESGTTAFLSSDWDSIESGEPWFLSIVKGVRDCDEFHAVVASKEAWANPWMNFELGIAAGAGKRVKILRSGQDDLGRPWEVELGSNTPLAEEFDRPASCEARPVSVDEPSSKPGCYLAHVLHYAEEAEALREILLGRQSLLTSAEAHRKAEGQWSHAARLRDICAVPPKHFFALIGSEKDSISPWLNYEIGVAMGRDLLPRILVLGGIHLKKIEPPIGSIHLVCTGDHNRMRRHLVDSNLLSDDRAEKILHHQLAPYFRQVDQRNQREERKNRCWPQPPADLRDLDKLPNDVR
jgi:hypothetical protein